MKRGEKDKFKDPNLLNALCEASGCESVDITERHSHMDYEARFIKAGRSYHYQFESYELARGHDEVFRILQTAANCAKNFFAEEARRPPRRVLGAECRGTTEITLSSGHLLEITAEEQVVDGKTISERFDVLKATCAGINLALLPLVGKSYMCQLWAQVQSPTGEDAQLVNDEAWTFEKFIYRGEPFSKMIVVMKAAPDQQGIGGGGEVVIDRRTLEDTFPDLHEVIDGITKTNGFQNWADFDNEVKTLVGGRREFERALTDVSSKTVVSAREKAAELHKDEKEGYYDSQKGFGMF